MQYTLYDFHDWRVRAPGSKAWQELGWSMTEEDAQRWAQLHGHQIERIAADEAREARGGAPA